MKEERRKEEGRKKEGGGKKVGRDERRTDGRGRGKGI